MNSLVAFANGPLSGKINISIFPNGLVKDERGSVRCRFSLLFGLNVQTGLEPGQEYFGYELVSNAAEVLNYCAARLKVRVGNTQIHTSPELLEPSVPPEQPKNSFLPGTIFFNSDHVRSWKRFLGDRKFTAGLQRHAAFNNEPPEQWIKRQIDKSNPLFQNVQQQPTLTAFNGAYGGKFGNANSDELTEQILGREAIFADCSKGAKDLLERDRTMQMAATDAQVEEVANLISTINSIYQHPAMSRFYGLIYDFSITAAETPAYLSNEKKIVSLAIEKKSLIKTQDDGTVINYAEYLQPSMKACLTAEGVSDENLIILDVVTLIAKKDNQGRAYHGLTDFGIVHCPYDSATVSRDSELQNRKQNNDQAARDIENGRVPDASRTKSRVTEGIYVFQKTPEDQQVRLRDLSENECEVGVIGQTAIVAVSPPKGKPKKLFSLCRRKVTYSPKGLGRKIVVEEEGWLHTHLALAGFSESYNPQTILHWNGHNLAVQRSVTQANRDQKEKKGLMYGVSKIGGFTFEHEFVPGEDTQLIKGNAHSFLLRQVLSNGYTIPLRSRNEFELSVEDLIRAEVDPIPAEPDLTFKISSFWFETPEFSLDSDSVNSPSLVSSRAYDGKGKKSSESKSHLLVLDSQRESSRLIFPPNISLQFAHFLGLLSSETLGSTSAQAYQRDGRRMVERAKKTTPRYESRNDVEFLADVRGDWLILTPADWFTRSYLVSTQQELWKGKPGFFNYAKNGDIYGGTKAGSLRLVQADKFDWKVLQPNRMEIMLPKGIQLKFFIQVQETPDDAPPVAMDANDINRAFLASNSDFDTAVHASQVIFSSFNQPKYSKGEFQVSHVTQKPAVPKLASTEIVVKRPAVKADQNCAFLSFSLVGFDRYNTKFLEINSTFLQFNDDSRTVPSQEVLDSCKNTWLAEFPDRQLLAGEYPSSIFQAKAVWQEKEVYMNDFGFEFMFNPSILDTLKNGEPIAHLNAGNDLNILLVSGVPREDPDFPGLAYSPEMATIVFNGISLFKNAVHVVSRNTIKINYDVEGTPSKLRMKISLVAGGELSAIAEKVVVPYNDLSEKNLSLSPKVEQKLLMVEVDGNINNVFNFVHNGEFFSYRTEPNAGFQEKDITLRAYSRFQNLYADRRANEMYSESSPIRISIPNNIQPAPPAFEVTPLLLTGVDGITRTRSMQLMFEATRPINNGEKFALILKESNEVSKSTCAIGRDLTTFSQVDFLATGKGISLENFVLPTVLPNKILPYLKPYEVTNLLINGKEYLVMILEPYFELAKQKWICVIGFDQGRFRTFNDNLNAYNPFIKIVAATVVKHSSSGNQVSKFAPAKYINIITERVVDITADNGFWKVRISNSGQGKYKDGQITRTRFVACVRDPSENGISGEVRPSKDGAGVLESFHELMDGTISLGIQNGKVVCVYEFETFDNEVVETGAKLISESRARLIHVIEHA